MKNLFLFSITLIIFCSCESQQSAEKLDYIDVLKSNNVDVETAESGGISLTDGDNQEYKVDFNQSGAYFIWVLAKSENDQEAYLDFSINEGPQTGTDVGPFTQTLDWTDRRKFDTRGVIYVENPGEKVLQVSSKEGDVNIRQIILTPSEIDYADESGFHDLEFETGDSTVVYDVVVYRATPAGITAAIQAAKMDKSVLLVESTPHVGGLMVNGVCTDEGHHVIDYVRGGIGQEFFERIESAHNHEKFVKYDGHHRTWEPHTAERLFSIMLNEVNVPVRLNTRVEEVVKNDNKITAIKMSDESIIRGKVFIDAGYEGDLMSRAGVSWTYGREAKDKYNESLAGIRFDQYVFDIEGGVLDENGELLYPLQGWMHEFEEGDSSYAVQTHSIEAIVTVVPENKRLFPKPPGYDPAMYELYYRHILSFKDNYEMNRKETYLNKRDFVWLGKVPNGKRIMNDRQRSRGPNGLSTGSKALYFDYPIADYEEQQKIYEDEINHFVGLMYFLQNDPRLPEQVKENFREIGLCYDEFTDNNNLPRAMYIRENKRMIGSQILTENDVTTNRSKEDAVALGSHKMDSHTVRHLAKDSSSYIDEGRYFTKQLEHPYQVSLTTVTPKIEECANLLVSYCLSASHVAHSSLRTIVSNLSIGQATGVIAALAVEDGEAVQQLNIEKLQDRLRNSGLVIDLPVEEQL